MSDKTLPRPPLATFCGGTIVAASTLLLLLSFSRMGSLGSIEAQEQAQAFVDSIGSGVGLTADTWQSVLRVMCVISGGLSVVTGFLGWQVLQRDRRARLALSVLAPVALVVGSAVAEVVPAVMTVAVVMLWRPPVREWFDGRVWEPPVRKPVAAVPAPPAAPTSPTSPAEQAAPTPPAGATAVPSYAPPPTYAPPPPSYAAPRPGGHERPGTVVGAAVTTIVSSALVLAMLVIGLAFVLGNRSDFEGAITDEMAGQPAYDDLDPSVLTGVAIGAMLVFVLWAVVAIVLAVLMLRGSNPARIALVVSSFAAAAASLVGVLAIFPLLVTAACVAVGVLLVRRDVATWFRRTS